MSLQVWLPLNGNLKNHGVADWNNPTGSNVNYTDSGKIGKALTTGSVVMPANVAENIFNNNEFSYCCWLYVNAETGSTTNRTMIFGNGTGRRYSIFQYPSCNDLHLSWTNNEDSNLFLGTIDQGVLPSYKWTHIAVTYDNPVCKIYINGVLLRTANGVSNNNNFKYDTTLIHASSYRYLNDVRVYDHCLSEKEVKELSKGLILHYPLNCGITNNNLIIGTDNASTSSNWSSNGWTKNLLVPYNTTERTYKFVTTNGWTVTKYTLPNEYSGKTLTLSFLCKLVESETTSTGTITNSIWLSNSTGANPYYYSNFNMEWQQDGWLYCYKSCVLNEDCQIGIGINCFPESNNLKTTYLIKDLKLEEGAQATPWSLNSNDTLYSLMGLDNNVEYDVSGYQHNGTIVNGALVADYNSPRYSTCYKFNGTQFIRIPNPFQINAVVPCLTHTAWVKWDSKCATPCGIHSLAYGNDFFRCSLGKSGNKLWAYAMRCKSNGESNAQGYICTYGSSSDLVDGQWYFISIVFDKGVTKAYINGELVSTKDESATYQALFVNNTSGGICCYGNGSEIGKGSISDVRLYATALSDEAINELYNAPIHITKTGTIMCAGEVVE